MINTYHEERNGEVFPAGGLQGAENRANDGAADAHEGDHDDEPANRDGLVQSDPTAVLGGTGGHPRGAPGSVPKGIFLWYERSVTKLRPGIVEEVCYY